jgi:hypothetical protein
MKLGRLIKMCLNEMYSKVRIDKYFIVSYPEWSKTRRCFIVTAFQLFFRIYNLEGPGKPGGTEIRWDTSAVGLC